MVDLAGSERFTTAQEGARTAEMQKQRSGVTKRSFHRQSCPYKDEPCKTSQETLSINASLGKLKRVITCLSQGSGYIPYRDSALPWLLKESLGGNSRTTLLATVSACRLQTEESLSTVRFACEVGSVVNKPRVNEDDSLRIIRSISHAFLNRSFIHYTVSLSEIKELEAENERLKQTKTEEVVPEAAKNDFENEIGQLRTLLSEKESQIDQWRE